MLTSLLMIFVASILALHMYIRARMRHIMKLSEKIPGPKTLPILGNILEIGWRPEDLIPNLEKIYNNYGPIFRLWFGSRLYVILVEPGHIEGFLNNNKLLKKSFSYEFLTPFLGAGLVTSEGEQWKSHRKRIAPAFHYKILEQFVEVFNRNGGILLERLSNLANGPEFDIFPHSKLCTLDNICETAMGLSINAQRDSHSKFVRAVDSLIDVLLKRMCCPWLYPDFIFYLSSYGRVQKKNLAFLNGTTKSIINIRRNELSKKLRTTINEEVAEDVGVKRRHLAFLDLMIQASEDGDSFSDEEIHDEVNTFMVAGYETTASAISFAIWSLATNQDIQDKAFEEQKAIFGSSDRGVSHMDLQEMPYLERVIKETLRLYPSVPGIARRTTENVEIDGYILPAGCEVCILPLIVHRQPDYFPDPETFDPDRFLPENCADRHPYSYIPFSVGSRNCIGQKFAMLELKTTLSKVLRKFKIVESNTKENPTFIANFTLKPTKGLTVKLEYRNT